jgi:hypothetical protein
LRNRDFLISNKNLQIWDLPTGTSKILADCARGMSPKIWGFAICGLLKTLACPSLILGYVLTSFGLFYANKPLLTKDLNFVYFI